MKNAISTALALLLAAAAAAADDRFRLDVTLGQGELTGSYETSDPDASIPSIDLEGDLAFEGPESIPGARLAVKVTPRQKLIIDYVKFEDDGRDLVSVPFDVGGQTVFVDVLADGQFEMTSIRAGYAYSLVRTDSATVDVLAGLERLEATGSITATDSYLGVLSYRRSDSKSETGPVLGVMMDVLLLERLSFDAHASYARLPLTSTDVQFLDAEAAVAFRLFSGLWARAGYRLIDTDVEGDDYQLDLEGRTLTLGVTIRY